MTKNVYPFKWLTYYIALVGSYGSNNIHGSNVSNVEQAELGVPHSRIQVELD